MVGNDVIDLGDPDVRPDACHARFDARVFDATERAALSASATPVRLRWILWACKEAAYKVAKKQDARAIFSPVSFVTQLTSAARAQVVHGAHRYVVALDVGGRFVHAVASDASRPRGALLARVERLAATSTVCPGEAVRTLAIGALAPRLGLDALELGFARDGRIPRLTRGGTPLAVDLSLSHHGRFVAFACTLPACSAREVAS